MRQIGACALAAAVLLPAAGCGSDKKGEPIPSAQAALIIGRLDEAKRRNDPLRCHDLQRDTIPALRQQVAALPANTDPDITQTLNDGIDHLNDLVSQQCNQQQVQTETTTSDTTTQSAPTTNQTTTTQTTNTQTNTNTNTDTNTNTNTNTNTDTTPNNGGTPGGATSGGKGNGGGQ